jgi:hypothetical protein
MRCWKVRKIGDNEYHVVENRYVGEPEYILARCTGPVPASDIAAAMRVAQTVDNAESRIHNTLYGLQDSFKRLKLDLADARAERYDEENL